MFNLIEELFTPGRKHTDEERKRLELTRVDLNDGDPGTGPIDLTSGRVVVRVPPQAAVDPSPQPPGPSLPDGDPAGSSAADDGPDDGPAVLAQGDAAALPPADAQRSRPPLMPRATPPPAG